MLLARKSSCRRSWSLLGCGIGSAPAKSSSRRSSVLPVWYVSRLRWGGRRTEASGPQEPGQRARAALEGVLGVARMPGSAAGRGLASPTPGAGYFFRSWYSAATCSSRKEGCVAATAPDLLQCQWLVISRAATAGCPPVKAARARPHLHRHVAYMWGCGLGLEKSSVTVWREEGLGLQRKWHCL